MCSAHKNWQENKKISEHFAGQFASRTLKTYASPAPPACFYGGAALAMYQSSMRKRRAGSSAMTDALSLESLD
jgi:hypothetical protein